MIERMSGRLTPEAYVVLWRRVLADPAIRARLLDGLLRDARDPESVATDRIAGEERPSYEELRAA